MNKDFNEWNFNYLKRWKNKNVLEINKINEYLNDFGPICMDGHIEYRNKLIDRNSWIDQELKRLAHELKRLKNERD